MAPRSPETSPCSELPVCGHRAETGGGRRQPGFLSWMHLRSRRCASTSTLTLMLCLVSPSICPVSRWEDVPLYAKRYTCTKSFCHLSFGFSGHIDHPGGTEVLRVVQSGRAPRATSATAPSLSWGGTFVGRVPPASWKFGFPRWGWLLFELCVTVPGSGEGVAFSHGAWLSSLQG